MRKSYLYLLSGKSQFSMSKIFVVGENVKPTSLF